MFDIEKIQDMASDLIDADAKIRKSLKLPPDVANPAQLIVTLTGLARAATSSANAIAILMSNARERDLLEAELTNRVRDKAE